MGEHPPRHVVVAGQGRGDKARQRRARPQARNPGEAGDTLPPGGRAGGGGTPTSASGTAGQGRGDKAGGERATPTATKSAEETGDRAPTAAPSRARTTNPGQDKERRGNRGQSTPHRTLSRPHNEPRPRQRTQRPNKETRPGSWGACPIAPFGRRPMSGGNAGIKENVRARMCRIFSTLLRPWEPQNQGRQTQKTALKKPEVACDFRFKKAGFK